MSLKRRKPPLLKKKEMLRQFRGTFFSTIRIFVRVPVFAVILGVQDLHLQDGLVFSRAQQFIFLRSDMLARSSIIGIVPHNSIGLCFSVRECVLVCICVCVRVFRAPFGTILRFSINMHFGSSSDQFLLALALTNLFLLESSASCRFFRPISHLGLIRQ